ncbi:MAG: YraN family protein [Nitriliruptoraceae bacterium]
MSPHQSPFWFPPHELGPGEVCQPVVLADLPSHDSAVDVGHVGEEIAAAHLTGHGYVVVERNWRPATSDIRGELDIVAVDDTGRALVIVEVKARCDAAHFGGAVAAVAPAQQRRIRRLAAHFLATSPRSVGEVRFDLVAVDLPAPGTSGTGTLTHVVRAW